MKSKIVKITGSSTKELEYPVLMESVQNDNLIVLFVSESKGVVLSSDSYAVGTLEEDWIPASNTKEWKRVAGGKGVTLSND